MREYEPRPLHVEETRRCAAIRLKKAARRENRETHAARPRLGETKAAHADRMERRRIKYERNQTVHVHNQKARGNDRVYANLSKWHPDFGMSPDQHEQMRLRREAGKERFVPKKDLRERRGVLARSYGL